MGSAPAGLQAMSWSPDLELAALVTSQPALLLITAEFEAVAELPLISEEFGDSKSMYNDETQDLISPFHHSMLFVLAKPAPPNCYLGVVMLYTLESRIGMCACTCNAAFYLTGV